MNPKIEYLSDLIFNKLKNYKKKDIYLRKQDLNKFFYLLLK